MDKIKIDIPKIEDGQSVTLANIDGNYILLDQAQQKDNSYSLGFEQATYDFKRSENMLSKILEVDSNTFVTNAQELQDLAKNTQNDIKKVIKINGIAKYYINKDDLIGKIIETIESNVNTNFKLNYPKVDDNDLKEKIEFVIEAFHRDVDIEQLIIENVVSTYIDGNYMTYLRGDSNKGYSIDTYPLGIFKTSSYKIGNESVLVLDVEELKSVINKAQSDYRGLKSNKLIKIYDKIEQDIKQNYPEEVAKAVTAKDKICFLDPTRTGLSRINNLRGLYGVTPIFKALPSMLMVETFDTIDRKNSIAKSKKIYHQKLRKELLGDNGNVTKHPNEISYAHTTLMQAMSKDTVIVTTPAYVEEIVILEPKTQETNPATILGYRNRVLNALGIGFLSNESKSSFNSVNVSFDELLKTINKISRQLEKTLNKYYKIVCDDNGIDSDLAPRINIEDTRMIDTETKLKIVDTLYSKLGISHRTVLELLGLDLQTEIHNRMAEQEFEYNGQVINIDTECFVPHSNSYTSNSNELIDGNKDKTTENQNKDVDQQEENKNRYENQA